MENGNPEGPRNQALRQYCGCCPLRPPVSACTGDAGPPAATATPGVAVTPPPRDGRSDLPNRMPYPYTIPLPPARPSVLDGAYCKIDPKQATPVPCKGCPDYAPEGGLWILGLDRGVFRVWHEFTGWRSLGSFVLSEGRRSSAPSDRLVFFNDPVCPETLGIHRWTLHDETLTIKVVDDACAIELRAMNLAKQPWRLCQPPSPGSSNSAQQTLAEGLGSGDRPARMRGGRTGEPGKG